jgi:hypothetical protein
MQPAKGPGKAPARAKAGEKRRIVLPGRPVYAIVAGLALAASLAVLGFLLFGPFPPVPSDRPAPAARAGTVRQSNAASTPRGNGKDHGQVQGADAAGHRTELPYEEHLAPRNATPTSPSGQMSEMRAKVEPPAPALPPAVPSADPGGAAHPVPGDAGKGSRLVVVIDDMGDHPALAKDLMDLPFPVTLAILPHRPRTRAIEALAAERGVEVLLHQPMQPGSYPRVNPGPGAVFTDMDAERVRAIVTENLAQVPHAVGINNHMGSAFTSDAAGMAAVMPVLAAKGIFFMDSVTSAASAAPEAARKAGVPFYRRAVFLDNVRNTQTILGQLKSAERHAIKRGRAIAIGHPYGETLDALRLWARERDGRVAVVTLTELGPEF